MKRKVVSLICIIGGMLSILFMLACWWDDKQIESVDVPDEDTIELVVEPGEVKLKGNELVFENWMAYSTEEYISTFNTKLVLKDDATGESIALPTSMQRNGDIYEDGYPNSEYYRSLEDLRIDLGCFTSNVPLSQLDLDTTTYSVIIYYDNNDDDAYYHTGYRIGQGGVLYE